MRPLGASQPQTLPNTRVKDATVNRYRLQQAAHTLRAPHLPGKTKTPETHLSVSQVANSLGYMSIEHIAHYFRS